MILLSFGRGALKSTTQGVIFDLLLYVTFDCAVLRRYKHIYECSTFSRVQQYQYCSSHFTFSNTHVVIPTLRSKVTLGVLFSRSFLRSCLVQKLWQEVIVYFFSSTIQIAKKTLSRAQKSR